MTTIDDARRLVGPDKDQAVSNPEWRRIVSELLSHIDNLLGAKLPAGGQCATCGFRYFEHQGHIIPCPLCEVQRLRALAVRDKQPAGWYCGCGHTNGFNLAVCARCGRNPNGVHPG